MHAPLPHVQAWLSEAGFTWEEYRAVALREMLPMLSLHSGSLVPSRTVGRTETLPFLLSDRYVTTVSSIVAMTEVHKEGKK
jgi:hypothetical protein